ncbi:hypothetical protein CROQUDRAFT_52178 [Cronartium quercuum f. sp. fusiforme G11]|uniref:DNA primase large subunit n=1 Tax=Cronartium quercuum f. sp. fusiforme G11 TaxID=708437 RepID=A0A9P6N7L1_9BASI|nr:hypothetical protein CROQUDRAFT_52178 [Cronartium quercuum f. sp. fusiforme G11]
MFNSRDRAERAIGTQVTGTGSSLACGGVPISAPRYPSRLNFYSQPPTEEITIEQFETWAINRLRVLAEIENSLSRNRSFDELKPILTNRCKESLPLASNTAKTVELDTQRKIDHYSHYVLRLAFCRSQELRARFVSAETLLFRFRLETEDSVDRAKFIQELDIDWVLVEPNDPVRAQLREAIKTSSDEESYYKIRWTKVPDLVALRKVYLLGGNAYVSPKDQTSIVLQEFSSRLTKALEITSKHLPYLDEDSRLLPVLEHLSLNFIAGISGAQFVTPNPNDPDGVVFTAAMVDQLAQQHFPPCMRHLWIVLQKDKHLKYGGRQQLTLFLKGIGLPVDQALILWRKAFCNITDDKFRKDYRYGIRHNYGLEGSRKNYQPMPCTAIIKSGPGPHETHGCPFKQFNAPNLVQHLSTLYNVGASSNEMKDILEWTKSQHYHLACTTVWECSHKKYGAKKGDGLGQGESVGHPNRYFEASYKLIQGLDASPEKPSA